MRQETFEALDLPANYWQPLITLEEVSFGTSEACGFGCVEKGPDCMAYEFDAVLSSCTLGSVVVPAGTSHNFIPDYVMDKVRVVIRKSLVMRRAEPNVTHVGHMPHSGATHPDAAFEDTRFGPIAMPDPPVEPPYFAVLSYLGGVLVCGGLKATTVDKKCR